MNHCINLRTCPVVLALVMVVSLRSPAQWVQTNGPYGGSVSSFAIDGTDVFAGTSGARIFRSTNDGLCWTPSSTGLPDLVRVNALAVAGGEIFAGTYGDGVFRSTDNGMSWLAVNTGLPDDHHTMDVRALVVCGTVLFAGTDSGVFRSTDNGTRWTAASSGLTNTDVMTLVATPSGGGKAGATLLAGTWGGGAFLSTDCGASWTAANLGPTCMYVITVAFSSASARGVKLFVGGGYGVFLSTDMGESWTIANTPATATGIRTLACIDTILVAGSWGGEIFLSTDWGTQWTDACIGLTSVQLNTITVCPGGGTGGTDLLAGTADGVYRSTDHGAHWSPSSTGVTNVGVRTILVCPPGGRDGMRTHLCRLWQWRLSFHRQRGPLASRQYGLDGPQWRQCACHTRHDTLCGDQRWRLRVHELRHKLDLCQWGNEGPQHEYVCHCVCRFRNQRVGRHASRCLPEHQQRRMLARCERGPDEYRCTRSCRLTRH